MIPILYDKDETAFASNGLGRLYDCITCTVTEERNGIYECDFEYPVSGVNFDKIILGRIIACEHDYSGDIQPFDIVSYSKPINGVVTFHAVHISYRQSFITAYGTNINSLSAAFEMLRNGKPSNPFTYSTDMTGATGYVGAGDGVPRSVKELLGGIEGSILDTFNGEYKFDRFNVSLLNARGRLQPYTLRYGVNLVDYTDDMDYTEAYNACIPYWAGTDEYENEVVVRGNRVDAGVPYYSGRTDCVPLDLTERFETKPTAAQLQTEAASYLAANQPYLPTQSITIDFVRLEDTSEYAEIKDLMNCKLCDYLNVVFPRYNMNGIFKIVKVEYDVLLERYKTVELGTLPVTLSSALGLRKTPFRQTADIGTTITMTSTLGTVVTENVKKNGDS